MTATKNVHQRLAEVMQAVTYIRKEKKAGMQYTIVSHDAVTAKVRPALLDAGIVYYPTRCEHTHNGNRAECSMTVRFVNIDEPSDFFDVPTFGYGIDPQDKGPGKAMSYAVKYALLKALGLETGDDADHDSINHDREERQKEAPRADAVGAAVAKIEAATTGRELLAVVNSNICDNAHPTIEAARRAKLETLIKGAQSIAALDAMQPHFLHDWPVVETAAAARRAELTPSPNADLGEDAIPY